VHHADFINIIIHNDYHYDDIFDVFNIRNDDILIMIVISMRTTVETLIITMILLLMIMVEK
jgi:hypothetical protein